MRRVEKGPSHCCRFVANNLSSVPDPASWQHTVLVGRLRLRNKRTQCLSHTCRKTMAIRPSSTPIVNVFNVLSMTDSQESFKHHQEQYLASSKPEEDVMGPPKEASLRNRPLPTTTKQGLSAVCSMQKDNSLP